MGGTRTLRWMVIALLVGIPRATAENPQVRHVFRESHMGTEFKIVLYTTDEARASRASAAVFARVEDLNSSFSDYDPESELMRLCDRAGGSPVPVSEDLFRIMVQCGRMSELSDGAFDATVNPVVRLWRRSQRTLQLPDPESLRKARELVDFRQVLLDDRNRTVQLTNRGVKLDLGGIAKGYACDAALAVLEGQGIPCALVGAAGDIVAGDPPPGKEGWTVGIAPHDDPESPPTRYLNLVHAAISTSGDTERFVEIDGHRYSHIVDPRTGIGIQDRLMVTVVAPNGVTADSLATALNVLGPEHGRDLVRSIPGAAARFVSQTATGLRVVETSGFHTLTSLQVQLEDAASP